MLILFPVPPLDPLTDPPSAWAGVASCGGGFWRSFLIFFPVPLLDPLTDPPSASTGFGTWAGATASLAPTGGTPLRACLVTLSGYQGTPSGLGSHNDRRTVDAEDLDRKST